MITEGIWPLGDVIQGDQHFQDGEECEYCFSKNTFTSLVQPGSLTAICNVEYYLSNTYEYMKTIRLIYEHVISKK